MGDPFSVCCWNVYASILEAGAQCISSARHASGVMRGLPSNRHSYRELLIEDPIIEGVLNYSITTTSFNLKRDPEWPVKARKGQDKSILKCGPKCDVCTKRVMHGKLAFCPKWKKEKRAAYRVVFL